MSYFHRLVGPEHHLWGPAWFLVHVHLQIHRHDMVAVDVERLIETIKHYTLGWALEDN